MKKIIISAAVFIIMLLALSESAAAVNVSDYLADTFGSEGVEEALPEEAADIMDGVGISANENYGQAAGNIFQKGLLMAKNAVKPTLRSAALILIAAALCSAASIVYSPSNESLDYVQIAGVLTLAAIAVGDVSSCAELGKTMITQLSDFSKVLLPVMTSAAAASGEISEAAAKYAATALFMDILITVTQNLLFPIVYAYVAAVIMEYTIGGEGLTGVAALLKWLATSILTLIVLAFVIYIGITGVISGTADATAVRVAKTTISTALPVVGSIVSDAASAVLVGASLIKNTAGVFGMLAVTAICIVPFIKLAMHYLLYKVSSKLAAALSAGRMAKAAGDIGGAFGLIMGASGACAMMMFFSLISFIEVLKL